MRATYIMADTVNTALHANIEVLQDMHVPVYVEDIITAMTAVLAQYIGGAEDDRDRGRLFAQAGLNLRKAISDMIEQGATIPADLVPPREEMQ